MNAMLTAAVAGLAAGGAYALLGVCAIFTYRLVAVVNFTGAASGAVGTFASIALIEAGFPVAIAVGAGILAGALVGLAIGMVMTSWFFEARAQTKAAVTVALLVGMVALGLHLTGGQHPHQFRELVPGSVLRLAGVEITAAAALTIALAACFTAAAELLLRRTRFGLRLRALSERPMAAELIGIPVRFLSLAVWTVTGAVTSFALMIIAPQRSPDFMSLSLLVVPALAAALVGSFESFWMAALGGLAIGVIEGAASDLTSLSQYRGAVPFLVILSVLMWSQRGARWDEAR
ncbi:amino acid/amide ABC transporter membrane protein 1, HAAT family [Rhizobiales bacterium GAS113]|nr:amino acid/amide ABC transporter membrane protein 1, HAAT family [Rhizobiales bacterium GAS113]